MVENSSLCRENDINSEYYSDLKGTTHSATIVIATKGAIVVRVEINGVLHTGVLLEDATSRYTKQ